MLNVEFEAKVFITASSMDSGGVVNIAGAEDFLDKIMSGEYQDNSLNPIPITLSAVNSPSFLFQYKTSANKYAEYNRVNNIGNNHYQKPSYINPINLQKVIFRAYGK